jgi:hypothetical protein
MALRRMGGGLDDGAAPVLGLDRFLEPLGSAGGDPARKP